MNKIEIYSDKKKAFLLLIGSIVFVVLGIWLFADAENIKNPFLKNPLLIKIVGTASILFFGFGIYVAVKQLFRNKLMLIIDENGINVNPSKNEFIKWIDIEGFSEIKINSVKIIIIHVINPEEYMSKETNVLRKKLMAYNLSNYGSPFTVSVATMKINYEDLHKLLNENLTKFISKKYQ
ncbi:MAG: STM3941 family protein [Bergeyella sp.]